ncbi:hypothetical protein ACE193_12925 [Bernardetia sp. OM2101]|uniref:hypothetical protein n=1 Tax=Bernardetia sp. OM2101 TaxID=3344876 RepID=UPI0035CF0E44
MPTYQNFIGIDVSKDHLDIALLQEGKQAEHQRIANNLEAIKTYLSTAFFFFYKKTLISEVRSLKNKVRS